MSAVPNLQLHHAEASLPSRIEDDRPRFLTVKAKEKNTNIFFLIVFSGYRANNAFRQECFSNVTTELRFT